MYSMPIAILALFITTSASAAAPQAQKQHFVFISDTQYPWTEHSDNGTSESEEAKRRRSSQFITEQAQATQEYRAAMGGMDAVPLILNGDITAFGHGWQRDFMYGRPFQLYGRNFLPGLGNHDYGNNVNKCANNGCARDMYNDMRGWANAFVGRRDFDYSSYRERSSSAVIHHGSLSYSVIRGDVLLVQLQNEPTYSTRFVSNGGDFTAQISSSLEFLRRQLQWARAAGKDVILSMHKPPYSNWQVNQDPVFVQLLKDNKDLILAIFAGHLHRQKGLVKRVEGIPVYLSGAAHYATWLTATYDSTKRSLDVQLVERNAWNTPRHVGTSTATASRSTQALPAEPQFTNQGWGTWGRIAMCPTGQFITTLRVKGETAQDGGDDTALNAVRFLCAVPGQTGAAELKSKEGTWGTWDTPQTCPGNRPAVGFSLRIEPLLGSGDDTAMGNLRLKCADGSMLTGNPPAAWGQWGKLYECPAGKALIGFTSKVEDKQGDGGDDTALNRIQMFCGSSG